jgi:hypothetical protein
LGIAQSFVDAGAAVMLVSRKPDGLEGAAAEITRAVPGSDVARYAGHVGGRRMPRSVHAGDARPLRRGGHPGEQRASPASCGRATTGAKVASGFPLPRLGEASDIGDAAVWLAANATWMTGQTVVLDGGGLVRFLEERIDE